jgi:hypothetical protein
MQSRLITLIAKNALELEKGRYNCNIDTAYLSNVTALAMKSCVFRNNVYNVFSEGPQQNNFFTYKFASDPTIYNATVPDSGFYSAQDILDIIKPQIQANLTALEPGSTLDMSVGTGTNKIEVTTNAVAAYPFFIGGNSLNYLLGNRVDSGNIILKYTFDSFPSLGGLTAVTVNVRSKTPKTILNLIYNLI